MQSLNSLAFFFKIPSDIGTCFLKTRQAKNKDYFPFLDTFGRVNAYLYQGLQSYCYSFLKCKKGKMKTLKKI